MKGRKYKSLLDEECNMCAILAQTVMQNLDLE